ncbi:MAG TPA: hypothetical protein VGB85_09930 [Nannocystis sp.]
MQLFHKLRGELGEFLVGQDHGVLLVHAPLDQIPLLYKILAELEQRSPDVHLLFPHAFTSACAYAELVGECIAASIREVHGPDAALPWPADEVTTPRPTLPPFGPCAAGSPARQIRAALCAARDLLPRRGTPVRLVAGLCPLSADAGPYRTLARELLAQEAPVAPWFHGMRVLLYSPPGEPLLPHPRRFVRVLHLDASPAALQESLRQEAHDPRQPARRRAQALLQLAALDHGHRRLAEARARYLEVLAHAQDTDDPLLAALAMNGLGDVEAREGRPVEARAWYERALVPAGRTRAAMVLLLVARNLGHLHFEARRLADAEAYFDAVQQLATRTHDSETRLLALEWRGLCQPDRPADRAESFTAAAVLARDLARSGAASDHHDRLLGRLRDCPLHRCPAELRARIQHELTIA